MFLEDATQLEALRSAAADRRAVRDRAHGLKGIAGSVGAARMAALCGEIERACETGAGSVAPLLAALDRELVQVRAVLDEWRRANGAGA